MVALVYCRSSGGKTVNSTRVNADVKGKNLLLCSDNSEVVLNNFDRPNLTIHKITHCVKSNTQPNDSDYFMELVNKEVETNQYDNIIIDNLSDLFDMWILELDEMGNSKDRRQDYQLVYNQLKRLVRKATMFNCNVIFTAWLESKQCYTPDNQPYIQNSPKIPEKVLDNICGLCNIVGFVNVGLDKDKKPFWYYVTKPTKEYYAKDQLFNRDFVKPELLFTKPEEVKK